MAKYMTVAGLLVLVSVSQASAQSAYPTKPMRWVVPFAAGGGTDMVARPVAQKLSDKLGQPILYDNRGGGGGVIAGEIVARAAPDGYTMLVASVGVMTVNVTLLRKMPFDPIKDFAPITKFAATPNMIATRPGLPVRTFGELIDYARANPRKLTCALSGIGTPGHLGMELLSRLANISITHVTYKGAGPATLGVLTGEADMSIANPSVFLPHIRTGRLRAIAVAGPKRISALPETPTLSESGFPGFESVAWFGLAAPARTPTPIIALLHKEIVSIMNQPETVAYLAADGAYPIGNTPEQFALELRNETARWAKVIKDANIRID
jgi:tripartite-type tricarboxylate transporter receptor subunit TctC